MTASGTNSWLLRLTDGRRFVWGHADGVYSENEARAALLAQEPDVEIVSVEPEEIIYSQRIDQ